MGYYAKKTTIGFKRVSASEATHVIMPIDEFEENVKTVQEARAETERVTAAAQKRIKKLQDNHLDEMLSEAKRYIVSEEMSIKNVKKEAQKEYDCLHAMYLAEMNKNEELEKENKALCEEVERNDALNRHFRRISRERANQKNGQSKKNGLGYIVLSSGQYKDRVPNPSAEPGWDQTDIMVDVWKTVIRTHYDAGLPLYTIQPEVRKELIDNILGLMGVSRIQEHDRNGQYQVWTEEDDETVRDVCGVYRWVYRSNFNSGCWEIELYHNLPVYVQEELRMNKNCGRKGEKHA